MSKTVVAYFSASGVTKRTAERLAKEKNADLYEICPAEPYTRADLDWMNQKSRSSLEMTNDASRPLLASKDFNVERYDEIYLGFPIWWGVAPHIVNSFLEGYDLSGKDIYPFATSGGSGYGRSNDSLIQSAPDAEWHPGNIIR